MNIRHPMNAVGYAQRALDDAKRVKDRAVVASAAMWALIYLAALIVLERFEGPPWSRVLIALAPLPAFAWFLWASAQWAARLDELERRIQLEALALGFSLTILLVMLLGLMQVAVEPPIVDWSYRQLWPMLYLFYFIGVVRARRRYM